MIIVPRLQTCVPSVNTSWLSDELAGMFLYSTLQEDLTRDQVLMNYFSRDSPSPQPLRIKAGRRENKTRERKRRFWQWRSPFSGDLCYYHDYFYRNCIGFPVCVVKPVLREESRRSWDTFSTSEINSRQSRCPTLQSKAQVNSNQAQQKKSKNLLLGGTVRFSWSLMKMDIYDKNLETGVWWMMPQTDWPPTHYKETWCVY